MKQSLAIMAAVAVWMMGCLSVGQALAQEMIRKTYVGSDQAFPNPERGYQFSNLPVWHTNSTRPDPLATLASLRDQNITIYSPFFVMTPYLHSDLDDTFLQSVTSTFNNARSHGLKVSLRMAYNWNQNVSPHDATLAWGQRHLQQLQPILLQHADVLAFVELGFVGAYGEWHSSTSGHVAPGTVNLTPSGIAYAKAILDAVPTSRMASVRYVKQYANVFGGLTPVTREEAYSGSHASRLAVIDHAIAYDGGSSYGTWDPNATVRAREQAFFEAHSQYTVSAGEPAGNTTYFQNNILNYARKFHLSVMSVNQSDAVSQGLYTQMKTNGTYDELDCRLGYRFRLIEAQTSAHAGDSLTLELKIANDGFARPYNPRALELILRDQAARNTALVFQPDTDLRLLLPGAGETTQLVMTFDLTGIQPGTYDLLLNLPDPMPSLRKDPRYSIRLANQDLWEPSTGYNHLGIQVTVVPEPGLAGSLLLGLGLLRRGLRQ